VARFDFSWGDPEYHQETLENLRAAIKDTKKLCAVNLPHVCRYFTCLCDILLNDCDFNTLASIQFILVRFQVMLDVVGPELQVVNKTDRPIKLKADTLLVLTPDQNKEATSNLLPINFSGLSKVSIPSPCFLLLRVFFGLHVYFSVLSY
jgi:pyruvate kinase